MRLTHIVPSLEERHGGPSRSVRALADALAAQGDPTELLTTLAPGQAMASARTGAAEVRVFPRVFPRRLCHAPALRAHLLATPCDLVHHHALWLLTLRTALTGARRHGAPLVISPRGMLSPWALAHHGWRKRVADRLIHPGALAAATGWHATSAEEADDIRALGLRQPICLAPNGVTLPAPADLAAARAAWHAACPALAGRPVALFYSRFHRKKRLRELLDLWLTEERAPWFLLLVGVPEEHSVAEVEGWIRARGAEARIAVFAGADRPPPYAAAALFLLPSHSENFGLVIAEALAAGVPALVTDGTPWGGLGARAAGWCVPWTDYPARLRAALALPLAELTARGAAGRAWVAEAFAWEQSAARLREFYAHLPHV